MTIVIVGCGNRGTTYGTRALQTGVTVTAIAERREDRRAQAQKLYALAPERCFAEADELLRQPKMADAAVISTLDQDHFAHAMAAMEQGYDLLLEKPISPSAKECVAIERRAHELGRRVVVCHVLRYAPFFTHIKRIIDSGELGRVVTIQHNENTGYFHMAHSFVRGNWRKKDETAPIILAKSCHDLDMLVWLTGSRCEKISSFGSLSHFRADRAPEGAALRCCDCPHKDTCQLSAYRCYLPMAGQWPASVLTVDQTEAGLRRAIEEGPYGRCVYHCDNDVCDHQTTNILFENGVTATFNLSAFTNRISRTLKIMCEHGEIRASETAGVIEVIPFVSNSVQAATTRVITPESAGSGHGGGDSRLFDDFAGTAEGSVTRTDISVSVESHLMALAAEESRVTGQTVEMAAFRRSAQG